MREVKVLLAIVVVVTLLGLAFDRLPGYLCFLVIMACIYALNVREAIEETRRERVYGLAEPKPAERGSEREPRP